eukprot:6009346-Ditylum_brightwellii.AAC.1
MYSTNIHYWTVDEKLIKSIPRSAIGEELIIGDILSFTNKKPIHMIPKETITLEEVSMAFAPVNKVPSKPAKHFLGHRGEVYVA